MSNKNVLLNPYFISDINNWTFDNGITRDTDIIYLGYPTVQFNITNKTEDNECGIKSDKLLVRPNEIYSASVYCKTSDYTLFDGTDTQVTLYLQGYETKTSSATILGQVGKNKADFPAQDWFRLKLENVTIPSNIHYVSFYISLKRNGRIWLEYPCLELNSIVSDYEPHKTDLYNDYYNTQYYDGIIETEELTKTQDITFNELNNNTESVIENGYLITANEDGIKKREDEAGIIADPYVETLEFRRQRLYNKKTSALPYTYPFFKNKLNDLIGKNKWSSSIDYDTHTITVEYTASDNLWSNEIEIFVEDVKPCNMIFKNTPLISNNINISEQINLLSFLLQHP